MRKKCPVRKAVFPVAGLGTRFLPATKAMPKELLPIIDRPIIQYAVDEAIEAGITDLIFVTGRTKRAIEDHFDTNPGLESELEASGKNDLLSEVRDVLPAGVNCIFVRQPVALGLGHAVLCAAPVVGKEPFAVLLADDFFMRDRPLPTLSLVEGYAQTGHSVISVAEVPLSEVSKYGIVSAGETDRSGFRMVSGIVEKPSPEVAPSRLASVGRYVFEPEIFDVLRTLVPGYGGEIQLADAINILAMLGRVSAKLLTARRYDCGTKFGYLEAIVDAALEHEEYREAFQTLLARRLARQTPAESALSRV